MSKPVARVAHRAAVCALCIIPLVIVAGVAAFIPLSRHYHAASSTSAIDTAHSRVRANYAALPLEFEQNQGQTDSQVQYLARGDGYTLFLTGNEAVFSLHSGSSASQSATRGAVDLPVRNAARRSETVSTTIIRMQLKGAQLPAAISASDPLPGKSNYFIGSNPSNWRTGVPHYARVSYHDVYPGVNLAFHGAQRQTEFDFIVTPGADPAPIGFHFTGAGALTTDDSGNLKISSDAGNILLHKPIAYQTINGVRQPVDAQFVLQAGNKVSFALAPYDRSRELVIDPSVAVTYSTYIGGSGDDEGQGIAIDSSGNAYITGQTASTNFPTKSPYQASCGSCSSGGANAFVSEINSNGTALVYSTYIGGTTSGGTPAGPGNDSGNAIAIDSSNSVFVTGATSSTDFPTAGTPFQGSCKSCTSTSTFNSFVLELNSTGSALTYSTYLGGSGSDFGLGIALASDGSGDVLVVGSTSSSNFPTMNPLQAYLTGSVSSGFVTKLNSSGSALAYSTYLGGSTVGDKANAVAVDSSDDAYVTGQTASATFHTTSGAFQTACGGCSSGRTSAFVTVINPTGSGYVYSTFLGGSGPDVGAGIAADSTGSAYVTGTTQSNNFPVTMTALQTIYGGGSSDAFVTKLNPTGTALAYSTYLGGSGDDSGGSIALDGNDNAYITGQTDSSGANVFSVNATQPAIGGLFDAFVSEINSSGTQLVFSTYLGGPGVEDNGDYGAIAVNSTGANIYVTGSTAPPTGSSNTFPVTTGVVQSAPGGATDAFAVSYTQPTTASFTLAATTPSAVSPGSSATSTITLTADNGYNSAVNLTCSVSGSGSPLPACGGFSTTPVTPTAAGATSTLTIKTNAPGSGTPQNRKTFYGLSLPIAAFSLAGVVFWISPSQRRKMLGALIVVMLLASVVLMPACGGGSNNNSGTGNCTAVPGAPTGLAASNTTSSGTTLNWTAPSGLAANCSVSGYTIYQNGTQIGTSTSTSFNVTGLSAATMYSFTVAASDAAGLGAQSSAVSVTTGAAGTPAGSYTITITATGTDANKITQTAQITLTVN